jgi:hypothetical protein
MNLRAVSMTLWMEISCLKTELLEITTERMGLAGVTLQTETLSAFLMIFHRIIYQLLFLQVFFP